MTARVLHAEAIEVAAEHCAWLIRQGVSAVDAGRELGIVSPTHGWQRVQAHVARRWLNLQMRKMSAKVAA